MLLIIKRETHERYINADSVRFDNDGQITWQVFSGSGGSSGILAREDYVWAKLFDNDTLLKLVPGD